jgi:hypothetical protein
MMIAKVLSVTAALLNWDMIDLGRGFRAGRRMMVPKKSCVEPPILKITLPIARTDE